jgi:hypothetical protein
VADAGGNGRFGGDHRCCEVQFDRQFLVQPAGRFADDPAEVYDSVGAVADLGQQVAVAKVAVDEGRGFGQELDGVEVPSYAAASGPVTATIASHTGKTLTEMKDQKAAERHYRRALEDRVPSTYQRVRGLTLANLAKSVAAQHRHEEAVTLWQQCLDLMDGVVSDRNRKELKTVTSTMAVYTRRGIPGASELAQRAAEVAGK